MDKISKKNFILYTLDANFFSMGMFFAETTTILPAFVAHLSGSPLMVGLLPFVLNVCFALPQFLSAYYLGYVKDRMKLVLTLGLIQRLFWLGFAVFAMFAGDELLKTLLPLFFITFIIDSICTGFNIVPLTDLMSDTVSAKWRGRLFGARMGFGGLFAIPAGIAVSAILDKYPFPFNFGLCFLISVILKMFSLWFLSLVDLKGIAVNAHPVITLKSHFGKVIELLKHKGYGRFIAAMLLINFIFVTSAFYTIYAIKTFSAGGKTIGFFMLFYVLGFSLGSVAAGYLGDVYKHSSVLKLSFVLGLAGILLFISADSVTLLYLGFFLHGCHFGTLAVSRTAAVIDLATQKERPLYLGLNNSILALFAGLFPVIFGILLDKQIVNYTFLFTASAILGLAGLFVLSYKTKTLN
ncbi:MAG: hypothetical protein A2252_05725 [Elusimicrobia bacterium RIFOXYA2_FULL_39_19]|nr:MAG: hypothetical protein A2252_05725 [Elusimicrobia bacterium RIFOXYA2_FULL_39_19]